MFVVRVNVRARAKAVSKENSGVAAYGSVLSRGFGSSGSAPGRAKQRCYRVRWLVVPLTVFLALGMWDRNGHSLASPPNPPQGLTFYAEGVEGGRRLRGGIYVVDRRPRLLLDRDDGGSPSGTAVSWSPTGTQFVAAVGSGERDLAVFNASGGLVKLLTQTPSVDETTPDWAPDGERIAFLRCERDACGVSLIDVSSGSIGRLVESEDGYAVGSPTWSPDGTKLAFSRFGSVFTVDLETKEEVQITDPEISGSDGSPTWTRDGIVFVRAGEAFLNRIYRIDPSGNEVPLTGPRVLSQNPVPSPDGSQIAFSRATLSSPTDLYVMSSTGEGSRQVAGGPGDQIPVAWGAIFTPSRLPATGEGALHSALALFAAFLTAGLALLTATSHRFSSSWHPGR